ncbi:ABC transporter permease subunit [Streptomyces sp. NPDC008092]|uniref:carbohydrate ABC transporter permease n=1 Tax=Streptomyces sp. NPDC008092 TaxID=3364808 RepID=UPI0036E6E17D
MTVASQSAPRSAAGPATAASGTTASRRAAKVPRGRRSPVRRRSTPLTIVMLAVLAYFLLPLFWLAVASTKSTQDLFNSFGLWFSHSPRLAANIRQTLTYDDGVFLHWLLNTVLYSVGSALGAALLATAAGYGFAKYRFRGNSTAFNLVLGAIMIPSTALAIPTYLLFAKVGLVNTPWAIVLPSLVSPFGLYLMRVYAADAVPDSLLEAARIDGAGELRIFVRIALRLLAPGLVTVVLFTLVATWNNYFLPLIMLNDPKLYPVTVGLSSWAAQAQNGGAGASSDMLALVVTGSLISVIPLVAAFLMLQRYWQSGLAAGGVKQ